MRLKKHLERVAQLPCSVCETTEGVQVHHAVGPAWGRGTGLRASDFDVLPLCARDHALLHEIGWREWEMAFGSQRAHRDEALRRFFYGR